MVMSVYVGNAGDCVEAYPPNIYENLTTLPTATDFFASISFGSLITSTMYNDNCSSIRYWLSNITYAYIPAPRVAPVIEPQIRPKAPRRAMLLRSFTISLTHVSIRM
jgi:hypothetical protein